MKHLKTLIPIIIIAALAFAAFNRLRGNKEILEERALETETEIEEIPVRVSPVEKVVVDNSIELVGTIEAYRELPAVAESRGRIVELFIEVGQSVAKGQTLAKIDDASLRAQLELARVTLANADKNVERYRRLLDAGAISRQQFEKIELEQENARIQVTTLEDELKYSVVKSPLPGIVKEVNLEQGSFANPGIPVATVIDINRLKLVLQVSEQQVIKIRKGTQVKIQTGVYPDHSFQGQVDMISVQADQARKFNVEVGLRNNSTYPLKAGMLGMVKIPTDTGADGSETALVIPRSAIVGSVLSPTVYVVEEGKAKIRSLRVGSELDKKIIVEEGLSEGEQVITTGQINLKDDKRIRIVE